MGGNKNRPLNFGFRIFLILIFLISQWSPFVCATTYTGGTGSGDTVLDFDSTMFLGGSGRGDYTTTATSDSYLGMGSAYKLAFATQPGDSYPREELSVQPVVAIQDEYGNTVTADSTTSVTVGIISNPSGGTLSGTTSAQASSGISTFTDLSIDKSGELYALQASASGLVSATSSSFTIFSQTGPQVSVSLSYDESSNVWKVIVILLEDGNRVILNNSDSNDGCDIYVGTYGVESSAITDTPSMSFTYGTYP
ncbi:MAG: hypothetical protein PHZ27_05305, partial [Candidatus Omnitrophica bacterium]|nr:hypothetical protein [Candidatus Omnitrophota bacterium]